MPAQRSYKGWAAFIITSQHFNLLCLLLNDWGYHHDWISNCISLSCIHTAQKAAEWTSSGAPLTPPVPANQFWIGTNGKLPPAGCRVLTLSTLSPVWYLNDQLMKFHSNELFISSITLLHLHLHLSYPSIQAWPHEGQSLVSSGYWAVIVSPGCLIISSCPDMSRYVSSCQLSCLTAPLITGNNSPEEGSRMKYRTVSDLFLSFICFLSDSRKSTLIKWYF